MPNQLSSRFRRSSTWLLTTAAACATLTGACAQDSATRQASDLHAIAAQLDGQDLSASAADLGLNAQVPEDGVQLVGRSFRGHLYSTAGKKPKMPRAGALTEQDLLPPEDGDQGIALDPAEGPLRSAGYFTGFRMHTEWFGPSTGPGLRLPGGQPLPAATQPSAPQDPRWHAQDLWYQPAQDQHPARLTLVQDGVVIHNDLALDAPGSADPAPLELGHPDAHGATPQRLRNVWVAPLGGLGHTHAGPWVDLLSQSNDASVWTLSGGTSLFDYDPDTGILTGTAVANSKGNTFQVTRDTYGDFELQVEVWTDAATDEHKGMNSGVQIRSHVDGGVGQRDGRIRGYQVEIDPTARRFTGGVYDEKRRGWLAPLIAAPAARAAWKSGTWNHLRIQAQGPVIRTWVNGVPAANLMDALTPSGHIGLQVHGVGDRTDRPQVRFRKVMLRELHAVSH